MSAFIMTKELEEYMITLRRHFHQHPELSHQEVETEKRICEELDKIGLPWVHLEPHHIVACLDCGEGKSLAMRGDIDALPMKEETGLPFSSVNDEACHSCGHDTHTAMTLTAAKYLSGHRDGLKGKVYFVFQGAEEAMGGAFEVVPYLETLNITMALGMHTWEQMKTGTICIEAGPRAAGAAKFDITVNGVGAHGSRPDLGVDPIRPACSIVEAISSIPSNMHSAQDPLVINVAKFHSGTASNIVPKTASFGGTIRYFTPGIEDRIKSQIITLAEGIASGYGASIDADIQFAVSPVYNSREASEIAVKAAQKIEGLEIIHQDADMGSDDFALYTDTFGGLYAHLGTGTGLPDQYAQHHPKYMIDEAGLKYGAEFYIRFTQEYLK